ncbi:hypothetical protein BKA67DRAFT_395780 [Truncatella angustata]|uniref:CHY-type domain-containing protein n=1 Tax=Truncatella angustata TaxID=152316 RepID=A0A9P8RQ40_9PEZI|nr:uncharacterized protein BKA67DRAFT_395780 [Truncatella angustata]KAH6647687.1 hypothetical protein BKA67DRAFT_395780 [Truncatella angustata]KAH8200610.1 hypothetical protein TruAng_005207 [Truncatella angustata]
MATSTVPAASNSGRQAVGEASAVRVVSKPVPQSQTQDPRKYQLDQLKKRFGAQLTTLQNGTTNLSFHLKPSDPDFPFELDYLDCEVQVPRSYPERPPALRVKNKDIPRGFSINIEKGWEKLVQDRPDATLLSLTNALDKKLEAFLSEQKTETVTLVTFKDTRHMDAPNPTPVSSAVSSSQAVPKAAHSRPYVPEESFTREQIADAKARRAQEIRQLDARMGRISLFHKSADGIVYTLPLEPKRRLELPVELQNVKSVQLIIPLLYPLQPLRILLNDAESQDAEALEEAFAKRAAQQKQMTLMSHLNYLTQNIHLLAKAVLPVPTQIPTGLQNKPTEPQTAASNAHHSVEKPDRSHIQFIPRPPEWTLVDENGDSEESSDDWDSGDESDDGGVLIDKKGPETSRPPQPVESGTSISFPFVELHSIELLQVTILGLNVKCERCRTINEVTGLKPNLEKASSCKKCATAFTVKFRPEMVHQHSTRAGFVDVAGCTVADMLPSTFVPTCGRCSHPGLGLVSVRGEVTTNICRECHGKFTFKIPEVKFLAITHGTVVPPPTGPRRRQEKLGLHAGEPLPDRGSCTHYKRSYRWFRFSCCSKVHPCDKCHDDAENHVNEWANRMICGWCSREQNYAVEACVFCGRSVIGRKGRGFWEGGKGTRDKTRMSRKDKRKYQRVGGSEGKKKE